MSRVIATWSSADASRWSPDATTLAGATGAPDPFSSTARVPRTRRGVCDRPDAYCGGACEERRGDHVKGDPRPLLLVAVEKSVDERRGEDLSGDEQRPVRGRDAEHAFAEILLVERGRGRPTP